ncbi:MULTISPECIES: AAA family ATPase [Vibrio]|jgi:pilus assembly protein CpaE|uniref:AAA family ATPase n=1 Tax=Vibrio TaxID=662 RepID=UPI0001BDFFEA|nr:MULTISPECIES: AAA family ATPase [Vibrio]EEZ82825.1 putative pilus assembly protein [Vibrio alginolyticus 40B]QCO86946.1 type II secretion protein [Vibrio neocaledonicus]QIR89410.1 AAA family ATPase [Vibrio diabolicus]EGQ8040911.1 AAA family ATPase [Vibrio alginolyticus]EGQ8445354.1 AAA family ATPase [Vibrio alginolyticus]
MLKPVKMDNETHKSLKTNLIIWIVYSTSNFKIHIADELSRCVNLNIDWIELDTFNLDFVKNKQVPDLIYIETGESWAQKVAHVYSSDSSLQHNHTALIVFGDENDTASLKMALRLGATDYLSRSVDFGELYPLLKSTADEKIANKKMGDLTLFINTKGGSGATTLAINTAIELSSYAKSKVLLVDLDMQFSDAADYLNCKPKYNINDVIDSVNDLDELSLEGLVYQHPSGLNYLCFNQNDPKGNYKHAVQVSKLLPILRQFYSHIIVDLSHGVEHVYQQIVSPATHVFLILQQNVTSVKHAVSYIRSLELDYGLSSHQVELIVNRFEKKSTISLKDIENAVSGHAIHLVPNNFAIAIESANLGNPIVQSKKNSALKASLAEISHLLESPTKENQSWIKKLFS